MHLFSVDGEYVAQGKLGVAVIGNPKSNDVRIFNIIYFSLLIWTHHHDNVHLSMIMGLAAVQPMVCIWHMACMNLNM